jgi:hypothetical protein
VSNQFDEEYENFGLLGEDPDETLPDLNDDRRCSCKRSPAVLARYRFQAVLRKARIRLQFLPETLCLILDSSFPPKPESIYLM